MIQRSKTFIIACLGVALLVLLLLLLFFITIIIYYILCWSATINKLTHQPDHNPASSATAPECQENCYWYVYEWFSQSINTHPLESLSNWINCFSCKITSMFLNYGWQMHFSQTSRSFSLPPSKMAAILEITYKPCVQSNTAMHLNGRFAP